MICTYVCAYEGRQAFMYCIMFVCVCVLHVIFLIFNASRQNFSLQQAICVQSSPLETRKKNLLLSINYTGCLIGILIHVYDGL